jgi:hypothetical protein
MEILLGSIPRRSILLLIVFAAAGCATSGPRMFKFASDLRPADGRACALNVLRHHGFHIAEPLAADSAVVAMRAPVRTAEGPGAWWRVEVSVGSDPNGRTIVTSLVSASAREEGPFTAPPEPLQQVGGEVTARCMWGPA